MVQSLAGALATNWGMLGNAVLAKGGQPEDMGVLGEPENPKTIEMVNTVAGQLVTLGNEARARRQKTILIPPQFAFSPKLQPKYLFILNKVGANATELRGAIGTYFVSDYAGGMMVQSEFIIGLQEIALVGVFNCEQLGVTGWPETDFFGPKGYEHVKAQFGLTECLSDDAPYIRIAHAKQELGEWIRVAHTPIPYDGYSRVFHVGHDGSYGRYLRGAYLFAGDRLPPEDLVAFRLA